MHVLDSVTTEVYPPHTQLPLAATIATNINLIGLGVLPYRGLVLSSRLTTMSHAHTLVALWGRTNRIA
jgi:hypothetical protein